MQPEQHERHALRAGASVRRCNQCWQMKPVALFTRADGRVLQDCAGCREARKGGYRAQATRRKRIDAHLLLVLVATGGQNSKLGNIPGTYTSGRTCPDACSLKNNGCYAEFGFVRLHWQKMQGALPWRKFLDWVSFLPAGQLWRHNVAGDLPGDGDHVDTISLGELVDASAGKRGFTFTHKPLDSQGERAAVQAANRTGYLTINLSADSLAEADAKAEMGIGPVVTTVSADHPRFSKTPAGRRVVVCPAQAADLTCEKCRLCANAGRSSIVAFRAHGQWSAKVDGKRQLPLIARGPNG